MANSVSSSHGELLVLRPKLRQDEALSSWIDRLSAAFGLSLNEFSTQVLHSPPLGRVDVDRNCPPDVLQTLAQITGTPLERVEASSIIEKTLPSEARAWVLYPPPHGSKHHPGLQYCPECLSNFGIFRRSWRFLFSVGCAVHGKLLIDQCPNCKQPIRAPYGDRVGIFSRFMCGRCEYDFRKSPPAPQLSKRVLDLQQKCLELCDPSNHASSDATGYLKTLWTIVTFCAEFDPWFLEFMVWEYRFRRRSNSRLPTAELRTIKGESVGYRAQLLECASWCMEDWPHNFSRIIRTCRASDYKLQASVMSHSVQVGSGPEYPKHPTGATIWPKASRPLGAESSHRHICESLLAEDAPKVAPGNNEIRVPPSGYISAEIYRPAIEEAIASLYERFSLELTACVALFARYAEEKLAQAVSQGVKQYVLFGAGLNTFAFRNRIDNLKVFEIDDPATQQWKRGIIALN